MNQHSPISSMETQITKSLDDRYEQIRRRAFEIYEERGREDGHDREDWLQAELDFLTGLRTRTQPASE